jgi:hypothetical protein
LRPVRWARHTQPSRDDQGHRRASMPKGRPRRPEPRHLFPSRDSLRSGGPWPRSRGRRGGRQGQGHGGPARGACKAWSRAPGLAVGAAAPVSDPVPCGSGERSTALAGRQGGHRRHRPEQPCRQAPPVAALAPAPRPALRTPPREPRSERLSPQPARSRSGPGCRWSGAACRRRRPRRASRARRRDSRPRRRRRHRWPRCG